MADKFYRVSSADKDIILDIAHNEKIGGIVAYSSDSTTPTAAYIVEKLALPGIPYKILMKVAMAI